MRKPIALLVDLHAYQMSSHPTSVVYLKCVTSLSGIGYAHAFIFYYQHMRRLRV